MRIKQNITLSKSRPRFRQPTNFKYLTRICTEGNANGNSQGNDTRRTEIGREITSMYFGLKSNDWQRQNREKTKLENLLTSNSQL